MHFLLGSTGENPDFIQIQLSRITAVVNSERIFRLWVRGHTLARGASMSASSSCGHVIHNDIVIVAPGWAFYYFQSMMHPHYNSKSGNSATPTLSRHYLGARSQFKVRQYVNMWNRNLANSSRDATGWPCGVIFKMQLDPVCSTTTIPAMTWPALDLITIMTSSFNCYERKH